MPRRFVFYLRHQPEVPADSDQASQGTVTQAKTRGNQGSSGVRNDGSSVHAGSSGVGSDESSRSNEAGTGKQRDTTHTSEGGSGASSKGAGFKRVEVSLKPPPPAPPAPPPTDAGEQF
jgi:hypothetical protein